VTGERVMTGTSNACGPTKEDLYCLQCGYNLTGLPEPRCPECGATFEWDDVRLARRSAPQIAFERARGWRKITGFFTTWATVLFAPWIFARQIVQRVGTVHGLLFGATCFTAALVSIIFGADGEFIGAWWLTAAAYIAVQTLLLAALDIPGWRQFRASLRFWLLAGCYTSAVVLTEFVQGPPMLLFSEVWKKLRGAPRPFWLGYISDPMFSWSWHGVVWWAQLGLWSLAVACIYFARVRRGGWSRATAVPAAIGVVILVIVLYGMAVEFIGEPLYGA
jgi:hypothetical protein